jgi:hypothetical protein
MVFGIHDIINIATTTSIEGRLHARGSDSCRVSWPIADRARE